MPDLYAVFLGGELEPGRMGEDHEVVFVVGDDMKDLRRRARAKWRGAGRGHVDSVVRLDVVDGHEITLADVGGGDRLEVDPTYDPGDG